MRILMKYLLSVVTGLLLPGLSLASESAGSDHMDMTSSGVGLFAMAIFLIAYLLVMAEEFTHLRKSKPVILVKLLNPRLSVFICG